MKTTEYLSKEIVGELIGLAYCHSIDAEEPEIVSTTLKNLWDKIASCKAANVVERPTYDDVVRTPPIGKRGTWVLEEEDYPVATGYYCSECHHWVRVEDVTRFCSSCGADMRALDGTKGLRYDRGHLDR